MSGGIGSAMPQNLWNFSTPQGKSIWWLTEEDGLEVDPVYSKTLLERYALAIIFYATGGHTWIYKDHFLSSMSVCHWNEIDEYDYDYNPSSTYVGKTELMVALKLMDCF